VAARISAIWAAMWAAPMAAGFAAFAVVLHLPVGQAVRPAGPRLLALSSVSLARGLP
jgi:hypothetical protein